MIEFLLNIVTTLVGNILELGDLYVVRPSRMDLFVFPCSGESERTARVSFRLDASTAFAEI